MEILVGLVLFGLWAANRISLATTQGRLNDLERVVEKQRKALEDLSRTVIRLQAEGAQTAAPPAQAPVVETPAAASARPDPGRLKPAPPAAPPPREPAPPAAPPPREPAPPAAPPSRVPAPAAPAAKPRFDWESVVGVRLFAAIAGISLLVGAVLFLSYSIEHGWLSPTVRVIIGVTTAVALLVGCEFKAAQQYPATANALDASAIAILFSTFFAAHSLWNLLPATVTFVLLALVTVVAALLAIRRDSMFIAVLGLLGGFLTPALLSTGENRPITLFSYLLLLNAGLSWVAYRKRWPALTALSALLTTGYQWGWVLKFLDQSQLTLAMVIFLLFPLVAIAGVVLGNVRAGTRDAKESLFERSALFATALPLTFGLYLAAVPAYGIHAGMLFGFLLFVDAGLFAVAVMRNEGRLHLAGAASTLLVIALWLGLSYSPANWTTALLCFSLFAIFFLFAPWIAAAASRPLTGDGAKAVYAAPLTLAGFAYLAGTEAAATSPFMLFAAVFAIAGLIAWRAVSERAGAWYFTASFFVVAALATWSATHLTPDMVGTAMALFAAYGVLAFSVPVLARRSAKPLLPAYGSGVVLLSGLALLFFLSSFSTTGSAIWGFAVLLSILNAALFVETVATRMPLMTITGGLLSWIVLGSWWSRAAAVVGVLPSLLLVVVLSLIMLAGYAWSHAMTGDAANAPRDPTHEPARFRDGLFLALVGHLFLLSFAMNSTWALPPWPLFGALAVLTLATSAASLMTRVGALHAAGAIAAAVVVFEWTMTGAAGTVGTSWPLVGILASGVLAIFALGWIGIARQRLGSERVTSIGAAIVLFTFEATTILASIEHGAAAAPVVGVAHVLGLSAICALAWRRRWKWVAPAAVVPAFWGSQALAAGHHEPADWLMLLSVASAIYAVFVIYPFVLGRRVRESRAPHLALVLASGAFLLAARHALQQGGVEIYVGAVPVLEAAVLAVLLRRLLSLEPAEARDQGRLALVAGAALAFVTVAIPLQLDRQWITLGWSLEGAALAWLATRIRHNGLVYVSAALLAAVVARLALNPEVLVYEPRGSLHILNWYLYTYGICASALITAGVWLRRSAPVPSPISLAGFAQAGGVILLFLLLNIEIADFYSEGPEIIFRFSATLAQDLTYTIGWLCFGLLLMAAGIAVKSHAARIAALSLIAITTFKCFLFDLSRLEGLFRVSSFVGLAISLALVSVLLQKYVLAPARADAKP